MSIYAIGDIQGCYRPLRKLLDSVNFSPTQDELWCVGDLINRGPESLDTLRFLRDLGPAVTAVLGNHDLHFLALYHGCAPQTGKHTLDQVLAAPDCDELAHWVQQLPLAYHQRVKTNGRRRDYLMVHAGVPPQWSRNRTLELAAEVEQVLQGPRHRHFLKHMYGNQPDCWDDDLQGMERLRMIVNYLTRMRFCRADGTLNLTVKGRIDNPPKGFAPWYKFEQLTPETEILFGHWAALEGRTGRPGVHALDTGCSWGRELTVMRLEDARLFCV